MGTSSPSGSTRERRTVTSVVGTKGSTAPDEHVLKVARAAALVEIFARGDYDGPDALVLRSTDGEQASERTYWKEIAVCEQDHAGNRIECAFTLSGHEGTAKEEADLNGRRYTLGWRPTGEEADETILFENRPYQAVWSTGEERSVMATMLAARFRECSELTFPAEGGPLDVDLPETLEQEYETRGDERPAMYPTPKTSVSEPVQSRSSSEDSSSGSDATVPGAQSPETAPPAGDRWIAIYGVFAREMEERAPEPRLLGAYKATESGTYKRADLSGKSPVASGPEQADVLLPTGHVGTGAVTLFVRLAMGTPSSERFRQGAELLKSSGTAPEDLVLATTPLLYRQPPPGRPPVPKETGPHPLDPSISLRVQNRANHFGTSEEGPGSEVYLINPLWAAERRVRALEAAEAQYREWQKEVGVAEGHSGLIGGLCYEEAHGRQYLADRLASAAELQEGGMGVKEEYDMERAWAPFGPDQVHEGAGEFRAGEKHDQLGQFRYGLRCKRAFLIWNRRRAARRATTLLGSSYVYQALLDLYASESNVEAHVDALVERFVRLTLSGGFVPFPEPADEVSLTLSENEGEPALHEVTGKPLSEVLVKAGKRGTAYRLSLAAAPKILADWTEAAPGAGMPTGMRTLAHHYMRLAHGSSYEDAADSLDEIRLVPEGSEQAEVTISKEPVRAEKSGPTRYKLAVSGTVKEEATAAMDGLSTDKIATGTAGLRVLSGLVAASEVAGSLQEGNVGLNDALSVGTMGFEVAALIDESTTYSDLMKGKIPSWLGPTLTVLGPTLDVVTGAVQLGQAAFDTDVRGQGTVADPDYLSGVGAVVGTTGAVTMIVASGGTALLAGGLGVLMGGVLSWADELEDRLDIEAADPLSDWLPTGNFWGKDFMAGGGPPSRTDVFSAVRPAPSSGGDLSERTVDGRMLPAVFEKQTKAAAEKAFYFPTAVGVRVPDGAPGPVGLKLDAAVGYLPSYGTLMVNARVIPSAEGLVEKKLECAVHYVETDDGFRYCVRPEGESLELPRRPEMSFEDWVEQQQWARAHSGPVRLPNGETAHAPRLKVHVADWPADHENPDREATAEYAQRMHVDEDLFTDKALRYIGLHPGKNEAEGLMANYEEAVETRDVVVDPESTLDGPPGLGSVLESGEFEVTGTVYFRPLRPFDPNPSIPEGTDLTAEAGIDFNYP